MVDSVQDEPLPPEEGTRHAYERAVAAGVFVGARRVDRGQIIQTTQTGPEHTYLIESVVEALARAFPVERGYLREKALALGEWDEPQPDAAVVGDTRRYARRHPTAAEALLVVEVAISTRDYDLGAKADIYAAAGITDDWVVCPQPAQVIVCQALDDRSQLIGRRYAERRAYGASETIVPLAAPDLVIPVDGLLPPLPAEGCSQPCAC